MAKTSAAVEKWHAVSVVGGTRACAASLRLKGLRFLSAEAPRIPLGDCTMPGGCNCVYRHFADRRARERRVADRGLHGLPHRTDRRGTPSRRASD
jgi:hypothetical protein